MELSVTRAMKFSSIGSALFAYAKRVFEQAGQLDIAPQRFQRTAGWFFCRSAVSQSKLPENQADLAAVRENPTRSEAIAASLFTNGRPPTPVDIALPSGTSRRPAPRPAPPTVGRRPAARAAPQGQAGCVPLRTSPPPSNVPCGAKSCCLRPGRPATRPAAAIG